MKKLVSVIAVSLFVFSCTKKANENEILIGSYSPNTGATATFGQFQMNGTQMAIEEINAAGGINGKKIRHINYDNKSDNDETLAVVNRLISQDGVVAILGEATSGRSKIGAQVAQQHKIPMLTSSATNPDVTKIGNYIFRACFIDPFQGTVMAKFMTENLKLKKAAILRDIKNDYSVGLSDIFTQKLKDAGGEILIDVSYQEGDIDFKSQLTAIKSKNVDAIFVPGYYNEVALIAKQAKELGIKQPLLGGDGWSSPKLYEIAKNSLDGSYFSNHYTTESTDPKTIAFVKAYREKYKEDADVMAALAYDAVYFMAEAIKNTTEVTPENIREELTKIKDFHGVTGKMSMNENRDAIKSAVIVQIQGPEYKYITSINP
ncbi:ABC transporter substrate-binding protein [Pseudobdellovibrio exovorus]|uniref:Branched-chain amino acid ABC transporter, amino acid-binding protein n=1 Tax=Pseudobdellovibrio exovorus JSS TaxID=1184267 RepID=M4VCX5_9BACT|nr:ABC transporter substrate-binding protein [Pseudobdellovibrio exovorus]AGH96340.1 branched-chain amino acid ABC transporter, amino acid-binding protein [Pseudobdellovibrio exovorus JSS]